MKRTEKKAKSNDCPWLRHGRLTILRPCAGRRGVERAADFPQIRIGRPFGAVIGFLGKKEI